MTRTTSEYGRYNVVHARIWSDNRFRTLSTDARLMAFRVLCPPGESPQPMIVRASAQDLIEALGEPPSEGADGNGSGNRSPNGFGNGFDTGAADRYARGLQRVLGGIRELVDVGLIEADLDNGLFLIKNALKYRSPANLNVLKSWLKWFGHIPESDLLNRAAEALCKWCRTRGDPYLEVFESSPLGERFRERLREPTSNGSGNGYRNGMPTQEQEQKQEFPPNPPPGGRGSGACEPSHSCANSSSEDEPAEPKSNESKRDSVSVPVGSRLRRGPPIGLLTDPLDATRQVSTEQFVLNAWAKMCRNRGMPSKPSDVRRRQRKALEEFFQWADRVAEDVAKAHELTLERAFQRCVVHVLKAYAADVESTKQQREKGSFTKPKEWRPTVMMGGLERYSQGLIPAREAS
jgi:hypothetical protein